MTDTENFFADKTPIDVSKKQDGGIIKYLMEEGESDGREIAQGDKVNVHYTLYLGNQPTGPVKDTSRGRGVFAVEVGSRKVIHGWEEGLLGMKVGEKSYLIIQPEYGYGTKEQHSDCGGELCFDIEVVGIEDERDFLNDGGSILRKKIERKDRPSIENDESDYDSYDYQTTIEPNSYVEVLLTLQNGDSVLYDEEPLCFFTEDTQGTNAFLLHVVRDQHIGNVFDIHVRYTDYGGDARKNLEKFVIEEESIPKYMTGRIAIVFTTTVEVHTSDIVPTFSTRSFVSNSEFSSSGNETEKENVAVEYIVTDGIGLDTAIGVSESTLRLDVILQRFFPNSETDLKCVTIGDGTTNLVVEQAIRGLSAGDVTLVIPDETLNQEPFLLYLKTAEDEENLYDLDTVKRVFLALERKEQGDKCARSQLYPQAYLKYCWALNTLADPSTEEKPTEAEILVQRYEEACGLFKELKPKILANRVLAAAKLNAWQKVIQDCVSVLTINPGHVKALQRKAEAYLRLGPSYLTDANKALDDCESQGLDVSSLRSVHTRIRITEEKKYKDLSKKMMQGVFGKNT